MADDAVRHGLDNDPNNDAEKGAVLGGVGGAAVGAAAGAMAGPVGAIVGGLIGAAAGAGASGLAVGAVDQMDNDNTVTGLGKDATTSDTEDDMAGYPGDVTGYKGGAAGDDLTGTTMGEDLSTDDLESGDLTGSAMDTDAGTSTYSDWDRPTGAKGGAVGDDFSAIPMGDSANRDRNTGQAGSSGLTVDGDIDSDRLSVPIPGAEPCFGSSGSKGGAVDRGLEDTMWNDTSDDDLESDVDESDIKRRVPPSTEPGVWP